MKKTFLLFLVLTVLSAAQAQERKQREGQMRDSVVLESVTVTGKSKTQRLREGALSVNAIDVRSLAASISSLNGLVDRTAGVKVREEGGVGSDFDLSINGMSGNAVRYFMDGQPMDTKGTGLTLANLPISMIDHIEIYKGVVPTWLNSDVLGGAINIVTNRKRKNYLDVSYGLGSYHTHKADISGQYLLKNGLTLRPTLAVNYSKNDYVMKDVEVWDESARKYLPQDRRRFHDDYFSLFGQLEVGVTNKSWADEFFVYLSYNKVSKDLQTGQVQTRVIGMANRTSSAWNIGLRYQKREFLIKKLSASLSLSHTWDHSVTTDTAHRQYDWNGDGFVNQLLIIYAGKGSGYGGFGGGYDAIWPHQYWMTGHTDQETHEKCSALSVTGTDGKTLLVDSYCAVQELKSDDTYGAFGTLCHEFSHCFGFPDFYYGSTKYVGAWDIMDSSYYNNNGFCPSDYSAHERWLMGWLTPTELKGTTTVDNMPNLSEQGVAYLIRSEGNSNEYYMVENRQQKGWDAGLPGSGILIFHIDYDPALWVSITDAPNKSSRQHYVIIPANNTWNYTDSNAANWTYPYAGNNQLTNTSTPAATLFNANADGTMFMNKPLTDLAVDASGLASFSFTGGPTAVSLPSVLGPYKVLYDLGPIHIIRLANGEIMKVMKH